MESSTYFLQCQDAIGQHGSGTSANSPRAAALLQCSPRAKKQQQQHWKLAESTDSSAQLTTKPAANAGYRSRGDEQARCSCLPAARGPRGCCLQVLQPQVMAPVLKEHCKEVKGRAAPAGLVHQNKRPCSAVRGPALGIAPSTENQMEGTFLQQRREEEAKGMDPTKPS